MLRVLGLTSIIEYFEDNFEWVTLFVVDIKPFMLKTVMLSELHADKLRQTKSQIKQQYDK